MITVSNSREDYFRQRISLKWRRRGRQKLKHGNVEDQATGTTSTLREAIDGTDGEDRKKREREKNESEEGWVTGKAKGENDEGRKERGRKSSNGKGEGREKQIVGR